MAASASAAAIGNGERHGANLHCRLEPGQSNRDSDSKCPVSAKEGEGLPIPLWLANCSAVTDDHDADVSHLNGSSAHSNPAEIGHGHRYTLF